MATTAPINRPNLFSQQDYSTIPGSVVMPPAPSPAPPPGVNLNPIIGSRPPNPVGQGPSVGGGGAHGEPPPYVDPALVKTYRPDIGQSMTDAEYAAHQAKLASDARANQPHPGTYGTLQPSNPQPYQPQAAMQGLQSANPATSMYTGQPTSTQAAQQAQMQMEAEFARQAAEMQGRMQTDQMKLQSQLQQEAEARRMGYFPQILSQLDSSNVGASPLGMSDEEKALRDMEFQRGTTRAREWGGGSALSALRALGDYSAGRGQTGSSMERNMAGNIIGGQAANINDNINDLIQNQMSSNVGRMAGIADRDYAGNLTKRGQNLGVASQFLSGLRY